MNLSPIWRCLFLTLSSFGLAASRPDAFVFMRVYVASCSASHPHQAYPDSGSHHHLKGENALIKGLHHPHPPGSFIIDYWPLWPWAPDATHSHTHTYPPPPPTAPPPPPPWPPPPPSLEHKTSALIFCCTIKPVRSRRDQVLPSRGAVETVVVRKRTIDTTSRFLSAHNGPDQYRSILWKWSPASSNQYVQ